MGDNFDDIEDLLIPYETVSYRDKTFKLHGLGLPEIVHIVRLNFAALAPVYDVAAQGKMPANMAAIAVHMVEDFAPVANAIIACGMRKPNAIGKVAGLPAAVQIEALDKIIRLTFETEGGLGKVVEIVTQALEAVGSLQSNPSLEP